MKIQGVDGSVLRDVVVDSSGRVVLSPTSGASTVADGSGTIITGGVAQNLFAGATPDVGFAVYNPHATLDLWINLFGEATPNAAGSIRIAANGGGYETPEGFVPNHAIRVYGSTTGQPITAMRW